MKHAFFPKLALSGIRKNRKLYLPYILSCVGTAAMHYIVCDLSCSSLLRSAKGGANLETILSLGKFVIAVFALIFLFYTNSFPLRRRYKEFGLYNVLGMDKRGITKIILWESVFIAAVSLAGGLLFGAAFSRLAELLLLRIIRSDLKYGIAFSAEPLKYTLLLFLPIFVLLTLKSVLSVRRAKPVELMKSENAGEKPPRVNWVLAAAGALILAAAYALSVSITSPLATIFTFFIAVLMVILATYLLFISGSVALCRILKNKKSYYYRKNHFVSVSSMAYRMKRNGAGLASVCILSTMVLVMISSSGSLYIGEEEALKSQYPKDNQLTVFFGDLDSFSTENISAVREAFEKECESAGTVPENVSDYRAVVLSGMLRDGHVYPEPDGGSGIFDYENLRTLYFMSVEDYNAAMNTAYSVSDNEALLFTEGCSYPYGFVEIGTLNFLIAGKPDTGLPNINTSGAVAPSLFLVISDYDCLTPLLAYRTNDDDFMLVDLQYHYEYDTALETDDSSLLLTAQCDAARRFPFLNGEDDSFWVYSSCRKAARDDFFGTYGALFFVGVILSIIFIFALAVIIYYKQLTEGYEDAARFSIMQKVGMTETDIKKSINSQILTVFFAPLLMSCTHIAFAFPPIWNMLRMFGLSNLGFVILVTVGSVLLFAVFYAAIYKLTAKTYYRIVSGSEDHA